MAYRAVVMATAEEDLSSAVSYASRISERPGAVDALLDAFDSMLDRLETFPFLYPESDNPRLSKDGYRKAAFGNYLALYKVEEDLVKVAHIFHQRQNYAKLV